MGVTNSNKVADTAAICCGDQFKMTLALTAAPDIVTNPCLLYTSDAADDRIV